MPRLPEKTLALTAATVLLGLAVVLWSAPAFAVSLPNPEPPRKLTVQATLKGKLGKGAKVRFKVVATDPRSWFDLETIQIITLLHGSAIQEFTFTVGDQTIETAGRRPVKFGGRPLQGSFLRLINGNTARFVRQTFSITLAFWVRVTEAIPGGTQLRLITTDQAGNSSRATDRVEISKGLLSWGFVGLAAAAALFIGSFVGNAITSRRYRQREPSIWQVVERRLREQRVRPPPAPVGTGEAAS